MTEPSEVVIGICTYRRPAQLARLLSSLAAQQRPADVGGLDVVVVDNSPDEEGREVVRTATGLHVRYVSHGAGNISDGRNRVLDETRHGRLLALLDDDEWPDDGWLRALLERQALTGADVVVGPVLPVFPGGAPAWLVATGAYGVSDLKALEQAGEAITGNVLLRRALLDRLDLTFDTTLGRSGGEDQLFFRQAFQGGAAVAYAPEAVVFEEVPQARVTAMYVVRTEFRRGNTLGLLDRGGTGRPAGRPFRRALAALWWALSGAGRLVSAAAHRDRTDLVLATARIARAGGMVIGLYGRRYDLYVKTASGPTLAEEPSRPA